MENGERNCMTIHMLANRVMNRRNKSNEVLRSCKYRSNYKFNGFTLFCFYRCFFGCAVLIYFFQLFSQIALATAIFLWFVPILAEVLSNVCLVYLVIPPHTQLYDTLS